jgi:hypothetical protein
MAKPTPSHPAPAASAGCESKPLADAIDTLLVRLTELLEDEPCDHSVNICWCGVHADMADAGRLIDFDVLPIFVQRLILREDEADALAQEDAALAKSEGK